MSIHFITTVHIFYFLYGIISQLMANINTSSYIYIYIYIFIMYPTHSLCDSSTLKVILHMTPPKADRKNVVISTQTRPKPFATQFEQEILSWTLLSFRRTHIIDNFLATMLNSSVQTYEMLSSERSVHPKHSYDRVSFYSLVMWYR